MSLKKYRGLFFDLDHTLCDTARADRRGEVRFRDLLEPFLPLENVQQISETYLSVIYGSRKEEKMWQKRKTEEEVEYRARLLNQTINQVTGSSIENSKVLQLAHQFMDCRVEELEFFSGVKDLLKKWRKNYTITIVTNGPLFSQEPKVLKLNLESLVDHVVLGGKLKHQKPHPSIYEHACTISRCRPDETLFIGDKLEVDIKGALLSKIDNVWVRGDQHILHPEIQPTYTIASVTELDHILN